MPRRTRALVHAHTRLGHIIESDCAVRDEVAGEVVTLVGVIPPLHATLRPPGPAPETHAGVILDVIEGIGVFPAIEVGKLIQLAEIRHRENALALFRPTDLVPVAVALFFLDVLRGDVLQSGTSDELRKTRHGCS